MASIMISEIKLNKWASHFKTRKCPKKTTVPKPTGSAAKGRERPQYRPGGRAFGSRGEKQLSELARCDGFTKLGVTNPIWLSRGTPHELTTLPPGSVMQ